MERFSTVDGFINVNEGVEEMIKYIANEPSVGLFFVQKHAHSSIPRLLNVKDKVVEKVNEVTLHTEDIEDSICVVKSMTECGLPIAEDMIKDINKSLHIMSASQPKRGLITPSAFSYSSVGGQQDGGYNRGYLSNVLNSAKQKAAGLRWPNGEQLVPSSPLPLEANASSLSTSTDVEGDDLPLSSTLADAVAVSSEDHVAVSMLENFDKFKFDREAKLEEWLQGESEK